MSCSMYIIVLAVLTTCTCIIDIAVLTDVMNESTN